MLVALAHPNVSQVEETQTDKDIARMQANIDELLDVLDTVNLRGIKDVNERLEAAHSKYKLEIGIPKLIAEVDALRARNKLKAQDVRGNKVLSPLEDGSLDEPN